ncbi:MAG: LPS export ABC transporter periplasmic protein LptC [Candidatus Eisenbacteria bacterium]|nr:LPS export ABC transporter periplasmic protein LptC [Candidatus Latescibacterota bacterium]MBD3302585.1 LPS export ABC transporter periplasmic protein LptC [Candidatus Eisenbacteria bacterium]
MSGGVGKIAVLVLLLAAVGCADPGSDPQPETEAETGQRFRNLELRETTEGRLEWILRADRAWKRESGGPTRLEGLHVTFYQGSGEIRSVLTSDSGRVASEQGRLVALGNVVVVTPEGNRLETEELAWDRRNAKVTSPVAVRLTRGEDVLTGIGFESDPNLERFEIYENVRATVRDEEAVEDEVFDPDGAAPGD